MTGSSGSPPHVYNGPKGIAGYKTLLSANGKNTNGIVCIPMEDDFGSGTADAHFEEGLKVVGK